MVVSECNFGAYVCLRRPAGLHRDQRLLSPVLLYKAVLWLLLINDIMLTFVKDLAITPNFLNSWSALPRCANNAVLLVTAVTSDLDTF